MHAMSFKMKISNISNNYLKIYRSEVFLVFDPLEFEQSRRNRAVGTFSKKIANLDFLFCQVRFSRPRYFFLKFFSTQCPRVPGNRER